MPNQISRIRQIQVTPAADRLSNSTPFARSLDLNTISTQQTTPKYPVMIASKARAEQDDLEFEFPFPPQQVSYQDLAPEIAQIQRPGKTPIVAFARYRARQVTLQFLVAVPTDGLRIDVENDLATLQYIASSARPVWFYNFDRFLGNPIGRTDTDASTFFWSIVDLSFESVRRNSAQKIVQAQVSMSLVENNNPEIVVSELPAIVYSTVPKQQNPRPPADKPKDESFREWTDTWEQFGKPKG